jgi:hypothetical protein
MNIRCLIHIIAFRVFRATLNFLGELNDDEKASFASDKVTPGAASGGLIALIAASFCDLGTVKKNIQRWVPQNDSEIIDEFDLPTVRSDDKESNI